MLAAAEQYDWRAVPWEERRQVAVGRYNPFCPSHRGSFVGSSEPRTCAREFLGRVTRVYPDLLDVGAAGSEAPYMPMANHSRYR